MRALCGILIGTICGLLPTLLLPSSVQAWSDEGHMLVAAVAKAVLSPSVVEKVEKILHEWDADYPGNGFMETSAVWLDHVACNKAMPWCSGFQALDDIQVFKPLHFTQRIYNPQKIKISGVHAYLPLPETGSAWALSKVYASLLETSVLKGDSSEVTTSGEADTASAEGAVVRPAYRGSKLSLNLHLRMLLHLYGDLHQPLHNICLFARGFPEGDYGGNSLTVMHPRGSYNLHHIWDSAALFFIKPFYSIELSDLSKKAAELIQQHPKESFKDQLEGHIKPEDFYKISEESAGIAKAEAYTELNWDTFSKESLPIEPSDKYLERVREVAFKQVTLAGYRLAILLERVAAHLPEVGVDGFLRSTCPHAQSSQCAS